MTGSYKASPQVAKNMRRKARPTMTCFRMEIYNYGYQYLESNWFRKHGINESLHSQMYNVVRNIHPEWLNWVILWHKQARKKLYFKRKTISSTNHSEKNSACGGQKNVWKKMSENLFFGRKISVWRTRTKTSIACGLTGKGAWTQDLIRRSLPPPCTENFKSKTKTGFKTKILFIFFLFLDTCIDNSK